MTDDTQYATPDPYYSDPDPYAEPDTYAEREAARRRNSLLLVAVAAVVCVVGALLALGGLTGGSGDAAAPTEGQTTGAAAPGAQPTGPPADQIAFTSPTGNIGCTLSSVGARCDIDSKSWEPTPKPEDCQANWGVGVQVGPESAGLVCAADSVLGQGEPLDYGDAHQVGAYRCTSSEEGMRCENTETGRGFTIARAAYTTF
jgi:hypothetical protein